MAPINGDAYNAAEKVILAIDDFAAALIGDREHFWLPMPQPKETCARPHTWCGWISPL